MKTATAEEYATFLAACGVPVHWHRNVWWRRAGPVYFKPVQEYKPLPRWESRPSAVRGALLYSHRVSSARDANRTVDFMERCNTPEEPFSMASLRSEKRNQVRKGLRSCEIRKLEELDRSIEELRRISISCAERLAQLKNRGHSAAYFRGEALDWREELSRSFRAPGHTWWGAFSKEGLIAYAVTVAIDDVVCIVAQKSHTEFLNRNPNDALYFTFLSAAQAAGMTRVINGGPLRPSLDGFKKEYGFVQTRVPYFTKGFGLASIMRRAWTSVSKQLTKDARARMPEE